MSLGDYYARVARQESGGNPNAQSATSSAQGLYGFTSGTWERVMPGVPFSGARDPALAQQAMERLTAQNASALRAAGIEPTPASLYAAHHLGAGAGPRAWNAPADTPLSSILSAEAMAANPHLGNLGTAGAFRDWVQGKMGGGGQGMQLSSAGTGGDDLFAGLTAGFEPPASMRGQHPQDVSQADPVTPRSGGRGAPRQTEAGAFDLFG